MARGVPLMVGPSRGSARATAGMQVEELTRPEEVRRLAPEWTMLALSVARPSVFAAPACFEAWRTALAGDVGWSVLTAREDGILLGVMPVMRGRVRRGPRAAPRHDFASADRAYLTSRALRPLGLRQVSPVVSIPAALVGPAPLCCEADAARVVRAMAGTLVRRRDWDTLAVPVDAAGQARWIAALSEVGRAPWTLSLGRVVHGIEALAPFETMVSRAGRNFRKARGRADRTAAALGLTVELHVGRKAVGARLPALAEVAARSWKGREGRGAGVVIPYAGAQAAFVGALLSRGGDADLLPVLAEARVGGAPVAFLLSLRFGDRLTALLTFHTGEAAAASPGMLLIGRMIDWAVAEGLTAYDLNMTRNWASALTDTARAQDVVVCYAPTVAGRLAALSSRVTRMLR